jgi:hypothetical protein
VVLPDVTISPGAFRQFDRVLATSGLNALSGFARIERTAGAAPFLAWGVLNDQVTSDGSVVFARTEEGLRGYQGPRLTTVIETAAYDTEVVVTNAGSEAVTAGFFHSAAEPSQDGSPEFSVLIPPGSTWRSASFVDELRRRGVPGIGPRGGTVAGSLSIDSNSYSFGNLGMGARVLTPSPTGGRYGVYLAPVPMAPGLSPLSSAWIPDLRQDDSYRTNLVLSGGGAFRVELFDPVGQRVAVRDDVPSGQVNSVLKLWAPGTSRAWARVTRTSASALEAERPFAAYAVINDGAAPGLGTGDGSIVWMETEP